MFQSCAHTYTGNITSHVCAHILWIYVVIPGWNNLLSASKFQPQREMKTCQEDMNYQTHTHHHHRRHNNNNKQQQQKRQLFPNTHQAPKTSDSSQKQKSKTDKAKTSQHFLLDRKSERIQKFPSCGLGSKHWPSQEFSLCQGLHPLERSILSLSELQKGFPLGEEPNITQGKELQRPIKI